MKEVQHMEVERLTEYEAKLHIALGDILRDLAILMKFAEHDEACDDFTYASTLRHIQSFTEQLEALKFYVQTAQQQPPTASTEAEC